MILYISYKIALNLMKGAWKIVETVVNLNYKDRICVLI